MKLPENDYQILKLTPMFYNNYLNSSHAEILKKNNRAYHFRFSKRSKKHKSGLDYTKIIIVGQNEYLDAKDAIIDNDEYNETIRNFDRIKEEVLTYVEDYIDYVQQKKRLSEKEFERRYKYSTLKYFHREMGIEN